MGTRFFAKRSDRLDRFNRRYRWLEVVAALVAVLTLASDFGVGAVWLNKQEYFYVESACVLVFLARIVVTFVLAQPLEFKSQKRTSPQIQKYDHTGKRLRDGSGRYRSIVHEAPVVASGRFAKVEAWILGLAITKRFMGGLVRARKETILTLIALFGFALTPFAPDTKDALHDGVILTLVGYVLLWIFGIIDRAQKLSVSPLSIFLVTYMMIILGGAALLMLPRATVDDVQMPFVNAVFMSASASCVTGLSVYDIGTQFTTFGQIVLLVLIQIGGLGIMTFAAFASIALGSGLSFRDRIAMGEVLNYDTVGRVGRLIAWILCITIGAELVGAAMMLGNWVDNTGNALPFGEQVYYSIFHSISAFCNAGFSLHHDSLVRYQGYFPVMLPMSFLIIFGGLGFAVLIDILKLNPLHSRLARRIRFFRDRYSHKPIPRLQLQTKLVLITTLALIFFGTAMFWLLEVDNLNTLFGLGVDKQVMGSFFQGGVTPRTAGFNTLDYSKMSPSTQHLTMLLMFIGASPGSAAGGLKTTAVAILVLSLLNTMRGRPMEAFKRRIRDDQVRRVLVMLVIGLIVVNGAIFVLSVSEQTILAKERGYQQLSFEVVSAFATTGLSTGVTSDFSDFGKFVLAFCMFLGRVGPVTLVLSIGRKTRASFDYPHETVMLG